MGYYATLVIRDLRKQVGVGWYRSGWCCPGAEEQGTHLLRPLTNLFFSCVYERLVWFVSHARHKLEGRKKKVTSGHENTFLNQIMQQLKQHKIFPKQVTLLLAQLLQIHHLEVNPQNDVGNHAEAAVACSISHMDTWVSRGSPPPAEIPSTCPSGMPVCTVHAV